MPRGGRESDPRINMVHNKSPPPLLAQVHGDLLRTSGDCGVPQVWEERTLFCTEYYRLRREIILFEKVIGIGN